MPLRSSYKRKSEILLKLEYLRDDISIVQAPKILNNLLTATILYSFSASNSNIWTIEDDDLRVSQFCGGFQ